MLMSCVSSKSNGLKATPVFTLQHFKYWTDFQAFHNKNRNMWISITLFRIIFKFANTVVTMVIFARHQDTCRSLIGFVISYEAILTLQLQLPAKWLKRCAWYLPSKVSGEFITFSLGAHILLHLSMWRAYSYGRHTTPRPTVWSCQIVSWL